MFKAAFALGAHEQRFSGALQEVSRSVLRHSSSGFSLFQFLLFLIRSYLCVEHWLFSDKNLTGLLQLMAKCIFGNVN